MDSTDGPFRVIRGGGYFSDAGELRSASRDYFLPSDGDDYVGFRLVRTLD